MKKNRFRKVSIFILTFLIFCSVFAFSISAVYVPFEHYEYGVDIIHFDDCLTVGYINPLNDSYIPCFNMYIYSSGNAVPYYDFIFYDSIIVGTYNNFSSLLPTDIDMYEINFAGNYYECYNGQYYVSDYSVYPLTDRVASSFCDTINRLYIQPNLLLDNEIANNNSLRELIAEKNTEIDILNQQISNIYSEEIPELRNQSYQLGFSDGMDYNNGFIETVKTIFSSPMYMINQVLNFNFFGVNLYDIFTLFITICVVAFVIKLAI